MDRRMLLVGSDRSNYRRGATRPNLWRPGSLVDLRDTRSLLQGSSETWILQACLEALDDGPSGAVRVARLVRAVPHCTELTPCQFGFPQLCRVADGSGHRQRLPEGALGLTDIPVGERD